MFVKKKINHHIRGAVETFRKAYLPWQYGKEQPNGFKPVEYDFSNTIQVRFLNRVYELMTNNGFNKKEINQIICSNIIKSKTISLVDYTREGHRSMELWEYDIFRNYFKMDANWKCDYEGDTRYSHSFEGNKLVLESHWMPKFYMVINLDDYSDFEVDFSKDKLFREIANTPNSDDNKVKRAFAECKNIMDWYFLKKTSRKAYPFNLKKMQTLFKQKWYANEVRIRNEKTKYMV